MLFKTSSISRHNGRLKQYLAAITVSVGAFNVGTVLSWTSAALPSITTSQEQPGSYYYALNKSNNQQLPSFTINHSQEALVGALLTIGALVSAIPSGYLADIFGRKRTLLALAVPFLLNWIFITYAKNVQMLEFARFMAGVSVGGVCVVAPMYIGEISETSLRGTFGSFFQMFLCCGILFTTIIGSFTNWMGLSLILGCIPILFFITFYLMPESPIYLLKQNKVLETEIALRELRGSEYDYMSELHYMQNELREANDKTVTIMGILRNKSYIKAIISVMGVLAFQQLSGINAIVFYTVSIFEDAGSTVSPNVAAILVNLVQVVTSYISILIIEKADRKFYLTISSVGMFFCLSSLGIFFHFKSIEVEVFGFINAIPIISTILFMILFAIGFGPIPWMLMGELLAPEIKGPASGAAVLVNWMFAFLVTFSFPILNVKLGSHVTFYILSGFMALATGFIQLIIPETRGKTLFEIQKSLGQ